MKLFLFGTDRSLVAVVFLASTQLIFININELINKTFVLLSQTSVEYFLSLHLAVIPKEPKSKEKP